jgi:transglutaminase-like putative cysteine protease
MSIRFLFASFLCLLSILSFGQKGFFISSDPTWVKKIEYSKIEKDTANTSGGYYYLLFERQINASTSESYTRVAIKVLSEKGLQFASSINESFDPSYQTLHFHSLNIQRKNSVINHLVRSDFELLQREENLARAVYDGSFSAVNNLKDVQEGDIVEYSYTLKGSNPVFKNHFFRSLYFNFDMPIGKLFYQILTPSTLKIFIKNSGEIPDQKESILGDMKYTYWEKENIGAFVSEDRVPRWFDGYNRVEITDFLDYKELSKWAHSLFDVKLNSSKALESKIQEFALIKNEEKKILSVIQFVQDEIRYLSLSSGLSAYKPHPPAQVFEQRYGDCKDKSLLLSTILTSLGIKSKPVLIGTDQGKVLPETLPSPWNFNHCIAQLEYRDSIYWIDPTISFQRGSLKNISFPRYYHGLVVEKESKGLTEIPKGWQDQSIKSTEDYYINEIGKSVVLKIRTEYSGGEADYIRDYQMANSQAEIDKSYLNFYASDYPNIKPNKSVYYQDDTIRNKIVCTEEYEIESFWTYDSISSKYSAETFARFLNGFLTVPNTKIRTLPYAVSHPVDVTQTTQIHLPEEWSVEEAKKQINGPGFTFNSRTTYTDRLIKLTYSYRSLADYLDAREVKDYVKKINDARNSLSFQLTYGAPTKAKASLNTPFLVIMLLLCPILYFVFRHLFFYNPPPEHSFEKHESIGGWLVLPAISISISPILILYQLLTGNFFSYTSWQVLTDVSSVSYNPALGTLLLSEFIINILFLGYTSFVAFLFWTKRSSVPKLMIIFYAISLAIQTGDSFAANSMGIEGADLKDVFRALIGAVIWIPYFLQSERVKGTFTKHHSKNVRLS